MEVRITDIEIRVLRCLQKGFTVRQIVKELGIPERTVRRIIQSIEDGTFKAKYDQLFEWISEIEEKAYLADRTVLAWLSQLGKKRRLEAGYKPSGRPPFGYKFSNGNLVVDAEKAQTVKKIFKERLEGKTMYQLSKETELHRNVIRIILRNRAYTGKFYYRGELVDGKYEPLIDEETWNAVQPRRLAYQKGPAPLGYRKTIDGLEVEPSEAEKVRRIFELRTKRMSYREISEAAKVSIDTVRDVLKNPIYMGVLRIRGELVKSEHEAIISPHMWRDAQKVSRISIEHYKAISEAKKRVGLETRNKILNVLEKEPTTYTEIAKKIGLTESAVAIWLRRLKSEGLVKKELGHFGKWFKI